MQDYKSLCATVTICATLSDHFFYDLEKYIKPEVIVICCTRARRIYNANLVTVGQRLAQIIHIRIFYDDLKPQ